MKHSALLKSFLLAGFVIAVNGCSDDIKEKEQANNTVQQTQVVELTDPEVGNDAQENEIEKPVQASEPIVKMDSMTYMYENAHLYEDILGKIDDFDETPLMRNVSNEAKKSSVYLDKEKMYSYMSGNEFLVDEESLANYMMLGKLHGFFGVDGKLQVVVDDGFDEIVLESDKLNEDEIRFIDEVCIPAFRNGINICKTDVYFEYDRKKKAFVMLGSDLNTKSRKKFLEETDPMAEGVLRLFPRVRE